MVHLGMVQGRMDKGLVQQNMEGAVNGLEHSVAFVVVVVDGVVVV